MLVMVLLGMVFVALGAWVGNSNNLAQRFMLDLRGERAVATAEPLGPNQYRLRFSRHDAIYARQYTGELHGSSAESTKEFTVPIVFDRAEPAKFLPAGLSYKPAFGAGALFLLGMALVLFARRAALAAVRYQELSRQRAEEEQRKRERRKQRKQHKHHHHEGGHHHHSDAHHRPAGR